VYFDSKPCAVCGAEVELSPARSLEGTAEPDGTIDERTCTNTECPTNQPGRRATKDH
jgi:hypothetical protein